MNNILRHLTRHYCISTKIPPFPALWFTHYDDCHSWAGLDSQDPPKRGKTMPVGIFTDYISMYLEISDSVGSSDLLKFFSHRPQRCSWPWRFLRRGCPDSAFPLCARKGQVPPWWRCWALSGRGTCPTSLWGGNGSHRQALEGFWSLVFLLAAFGHIWECAWTANMGSLACGHYAYNPVRDRLLPLFLTEVEIPLSKVIHVVSRP